MAKAAALRTIPPHNPLATTAADAYEFESVVPKQHWDKLNWKALFDTFTKASTSGSADPRGDPFVSFMLEKRRPEAVTGPGVDRLKDACRWLALYSVCHSLSERPRTIRLEDGAPHHYQCFLFNRIIC